MNLKHEIQNAKQFYKDIKFRVKAGAYDEKIAIALVMALIYITVSVTLLMIKG